MVWESVCLTIPAIKSSNSRTGRPPSGSLSARNTRTSEAVMSTPAHRGSFGNNRHSAMPDPSSSARSVATMAISARAYRGYKRSHRYRRVCFGRSCRRRRQCDAKSMTALVSGKRAKLGEVYIPRPVTHPSREARICNYEVAPSQSPWSKGE